MAQKIIVAAGLEIRDYQGQEMLRFLNANADAGPNSTWTYPKGAGAKAKYVVEVVYTMAEFAKALDTPDAYVIYEGHSRLGQGPAFGPANTPHVPDQKAFPVNPWGVHFRMGYDATNTEALCDLVEHSVTPAEYDLTTAPAGAFLPEALTKAADKAKRIEAKIKRGRMRRSHLCPVLGAWRTFKACEPALDATTTARGDAPLKDRHFYGQQRKLCLPKSRPDDMLTAVQVGSADLDAVALKCKVLFMASCSSRVHYLGPLKRRRKAAKSTCKFYLTSAVPQAYHARNFIEQVFKGVDPASRQGAKAMEKALNGVPRSGRVHVY